jgi:hypothetical protein
MPSTVPILNVRLISPSMVISRSYTRDVRTSDHGLCHIPGPSTSYGSTAILDPLHLDVSSLFSGYKRSELFDDWDIIASANCNYSMAPHVHVTATSL